MIRAFCPECGGFSFGYDPSAKIYRCYDVKCPFVDKEKKYGGGLSENPFTKLDVSGDGLERITALEEVSKRIPSLIVKD